MKDCGDTSRLSCVTDGQPGRSVVPREKRPLALCSLEPECQGRHSWAFIALRFVNAEQTVTSRCKLKEEAIGEQGEQKQYLSSGTSSHESVFQETCIGGRSL